MTNTWFKIPKRRLYTWTSPKHTAQNIVRNQIDFILINNRYRNAIKSVKTYPGADIMSDHNTLVAVFQVKLKKIQVKQKPNKLYLESLKDENTQIKIKTDINKNLKEIRLSSNRDKDAEEKWKEIKTSLWDAARESLKPVKQEAKKSWMTTKILRLMDERRSYKGRNETKYRQTHKQIKNKIKEKEQFWSDKCKELEDLQEKHDIFGMHKYIKEMTRTGRKNQYGQIKDKDGVPYSIN